MTHGARRLAGRLSERQPVLLDGAMGTELERRGIATPYPLWSATALLTHPDVVRDVHRDYVRAGARLLVTNTFRTLERALAEACAAGHSLPTDLDAESLVTLAVELALEARGDTSDVWVLGSMAPLEDCFSPHLVPDAATLDRDHRTRADQLVAAGVDGLLVETMTTRREAVAATRIAADSGLPVLSAFVANPDGCLFDGTDLDLVVPALFDAGASIVLVNCTPLPASRRAAAALARLAGGRPFGIYANNGYGHPTIDPALGEPIPGSTVPMAPADYAGEARAWIELGARVIGGCCGTGPDTIRALAALL